MNSFSLLVLSIFFLAYYFSSMLFQLLEIFGEAIVWSSGCSRKMLSFPIHCNQYPQQWTYYIISSFPQLNSTQGEISVYTVSRSYLLARERSQLQKIHRKKTNCKGGHYLWKTSLSPIRCCQIIIVISVYQWNCRRESMYCLTLVSFWLFQDFRVILSICSQNQASVLLMAKFLLTWAVLYKLSEL